jgi:hypothetical protein
MGPLRHSTSVGDHTSRRSSRRAKDCNISSTGPQSEGNIWEPWQERGLEIFWFLDLKSNMGWNAISGRTSDTLCSRRTSSDTGYAVFKGKVAVIRGGNRGRGNRGQTGRFLD